MVSERCSGKMVCMRESELLDTCMGLADLLLQKAQFVLGISHMEPELTHAQLMKIRCGGVIGMAQVLGLDTQTPPRIREVITAAESQYTHLADFPYSDILPTIQNFRLRRHKTD